MRVLLNAPHRASSSAGARSSLGNPEGRRTPREVWFVLALVIATFVVLSSVVALKTPAWESNDEPDHVQDIETLVAGHWYGMHFEPKTATIDGHIVVGDAAVDVGTEAHQAPLYYLLLAGWQWVVGVRPRTPDPGSMTVYVAHGSYLHHSAADHRFLLWLRFPNIAMGALSVWLTFLAARIVARDVWTPVVAAAIIGFLPRFVFLSAFVTNDNLVNLLGALLALLSLRFLVSPTRWRMALVGAVVGLLITTKLSALPFVAIVIVLALRRPGWLERVRLMAIGAAACLTLCGWYLIQNTVRYGDPLALTVSRRYLALVGGVGTPFGLPYRIVDPLKYVTVDVPRKFLDVFWYGSGWQEYFRWPWPVGLVFWLALACALVSLVGRHVPRRTLVVLVVLTVAGFLSVWMVSLQSGTYDPRLALGGVPALACLAALGLERWRLAIRSLLPLALLAGTVFAIHADVLGTSWS